MSANDVSHAQACAYRNNLILNKLDPLASWTQSRHGNAITVERKGGDIVKILRGHLASLQEHELDAYLEVWKKQHIIRRVATFNRLESRRSDLTEKSIILKDYGPDFLDWLHLIGSPCLEPQFHNLALPERRQPLGPLRNPRVLLAMARALLESLEPFHRAGFVHCDIKHDNFCIQHRLLTEHSPSLSHVITGELDLDSLTTIDLGCCLLPVGGSHRRVIHCTREDRLPLYIGAVPATRQGYTWPVLLGARTERDARLAASAIMAEGWTGRHADIPKPAANRYISDYYLLCCELAVLGHPDALNRLDWRIDFFSLSYLLENILRHVTRERQLEEAPAALVTYLMQLPGRIRAYDTSPFDDAPEIPHGTLVEEINELLGEEACRRIPFEIVPNANPTPWFAAPPETILTLLGEDTPLPSGETPLRVAGNAPGRPHIEFHDFAEAPLLIALPTGIAWLGSPLNEAGRSEHELLPRQVHVTAFALGKYPVTFEEWDAFLYSTGQPILSEQDQGWGRQTRPVINVNLDQIRTYLAWLNQIAGWRECDPHRYRLPTADEWEYATRAGSRSPYPQGETLRPEAAQFHIRPVPKGELPRDRTAPVGRFAANPWAFHDLLGNVWEYVDGGKPFLCGGSWLNGPAFLRPSTRQQPPAGERGNHIGFRVARSLGRLG